jgi:type VI secretion system secreted protein Hcp
MPIPAYMWINDGEIKGGCTVAGREDSIEVLEFNHEVRIPTDPDTGTLTGTRKHEAFRIVKAFDQSSALLYKAVCEGLTYETLRLEWYKIDDEGAEIMYFKHELEQVKVCSVKPIMYNVKAKEYERYVHMEEVSFRYGKIKWEYPDGGYEHTDSWLEGR